MEFPSLHHVQNFSYNGIFVMSKKSFAEWTIQKFIKWTDDPGVALFLCSDRVKRGIPTCQLHPDYSKTLPGVPRLNVQPGKFYQFGGKRGLIVFCVAEDLETFSGVVVKQAVDRNGKTDEKDEWVVGKFEKHWNADSRRFKEVPNPFINK